MFCPACGTSVPAESSFCLKCGQSLPAATAPDPTIQRGTKRRARVWVRSASLGTLGAIALAYAFYASKSHATEGPEHGKTPVVDVRPAPEPPVKLSPGEIAAKFATAVVVLEGYDERGQKIGQGSGFICADGKVLTNYHVIRGTSRIVARMRDSATVDVSHIAAFSIASDLAALQIEGDQLPSVKLGDSATVKVGDHVTILGAPLGLESTLSDGIISAIREGGPLRIFQTTAPISHGSSGGPLFDEYGNVVGLAVAMIESGENLNFAVPIDAAKAMLAKARVISFEEMLAATAMRQPLLSSSISIPPQQVPIEVAVPRQGARLVGSFSIAGGMSNDLAVRVVSDRGVLVWNGGILKNSVQLDIPLASGRYRLVLDNKAGPFWMASKTISGTLELAYYR